MRLSISLTLPIMMVVLCGVSSIVVGVQAYHSVERLLGEMPPAFVAEVMESLEYTLLYTVIGLMVATQLLGQLYVAQHISARLKRIVQAMLALRDGNKNVEVPYLNSNDEIGDLASALQSFKVAAAEAERLSAERAEHQQEKLKRQSEIDGLVQRFDKTVSNVIHELSNASDAMSGAAERMVDVAATSSHRSEATASASEETSSNVRAVAAAAEELSASISAISSQMARSAEISKDAVSRTRSADGTVQDLAQAAQRIGDVIRLIDDIADQINLLALNATIESARAGEAGKGFAVVASEVKTLASQTSKATQEIASQIKSIQDVSSAVVAVLNSIRETINELNDIATSIAASVEEQGAATQEIARNMSAAAGIVQEVSSNSAAMKQASQETDQSARKVLDASKHVSERAGAIQHEVEEFLERIRA